MKLVFDIEANGLKEIKIENGKVKLEGNNVWCICAEDIDTGKQYKFGPSQLEQGVALLRQAELLIGHNVLFYDIPMLERLFGTIDVPVFDTLIVSQLRYPDRQNHPFGNNKLHSWGIHLGCFKQDFNQGFDGYTEDMLAYCMQDVVVTKKVYENLLEFSKTVELPLKIEHQIGKIINAQVDNGIGFDIHGANLLEQELLMEKIEIEDRFNEIFPPIVEDQRYHKKTNKPLKRKIEYFNPASRQQIAKRLKDKYGWKAPLTDKGNPKVDEAVLKDLTFPEVEHLLKYMNIIKLLGFIQDWITRAVNSRDGRIHGDVHTQGCVTGRMSSSQPNLQQVSGDPRARALFKPRDGWVQVGIDASGLEARLLANRMAKYDNGKFADVVLNGDIHTENQTAAGLDTRAQAKTFFFALIYGGGDAKIGAIINKDANAGKKVKERFLNAMPALKRVLENCNFQIAKKGTITLLDGREVPCRAKHKALNVQIQGDGAVLMKVAQIIFHKKLEKYCPDSYAFMATVHDEWQLECDPNYAEQIAKLGCESITKAGEFFKCLIRMDGDFRIGNNWFECH